MSHPGDANFVKAGEHMTCQNDLTNDLSTIRRSAGAQFKETLNPSFQMSVPRKAAANNGYECPKCEDDTTWIPARYVLAILGFLGFFNLFALRVTMSVAIVAMVDTAVSGNGSVLSEAEFCPYPNVTETPHPTGEFDWDSKTQGVILGSFFYGYICTQLPGAWLARKFGGKHMYGCSTLLAGLLALFIPLAARFSYGALIAIRVLQGFCQGVCFPSMHTLMSKWAPPLERTKIVTVAYTGSHVGTVVSLVLSGYLAESLGWDSIFYLFGSLSVAWYILWFFFAFDSPEKHPRISAAERDYIITSIGHANETNIVPWKTLLLSPPVWAIAVGHFGSNWGFYTLLTNLPTFLSNILHFSLKKNGVISAMPYLAMAILMPIFALIADALRRHKILSTTWVRRLFHFAGQLLPAACLVGVGYIGCNVVLAVTLLTMAVGTAAFAASGFQVNHIDISPSFAGILMGFSNTLGTVPGIVGPYVAGVITDGPLGQTVTQWRIVFFISAGIYVTTAIFYVIFASGEPQSWERGRKKSLHPVEVEDLLVPVPGVATCPA